MPALSAMLVVLVSAPLTGQRHIIREFTAEDGLRTPWVFDIEQDTSGFLWIDRKSVV